METHNLYDADTCELVQTYKSHEELLKATQSMQQQVPSTLVLRRIDDNQYEDENYTYFLYKDDIKDEPPTELKQPPSLSQLVHKPAVKSSEHYGPQILSALDKYFTEIVQVSQKRLEECKKCRDQSLLRRDAIKTLVKSYMVTVLKEYDRKYHQVADGVDQTTAFCDHFLKGGIQSVIQALKTTKYQDEKYNTLMDFLTRMDKEYSEQGLIENYEMVQKVLTTSKQAADMQKPALQFCHGRIDGYQQQIEQGQSLQQQWRDIIFRAKDLFERQEIILAEFKKSRTSLDQLFTRTDRDSGLLIMSAQTELEERQFEKKLIDQDDELREVLWKCIELFVKEHAKIKMEPMMKLRQRMAQFLGTLDGVHQTVQKTLVRGSLARIKFAYHLPTMYPLCIAEVLRRKDFKKMMHIELDNLIEVIELAFRGENGERVKYTKQIKMRIGDDDVHRELLDQLVPGLMDIIKDQEIISEYRQLKDRTLHSFDMKLINVDAVNKTEAEFVFIDDENYDSQAEQVIKPKLQNPQIMADHMSATMFFNEVSKQSNEVKEMMSEVNQHERQRQVELQKQRQEKLTKLQQRAEQIDDDDEEEEENVVKIAELEQQRKEWELEKEKLEQKSEELIHEMEQEKSKQLEKVRELEQLRTELAEKGNSLDRLQSEEQSLCDALQKSQTQCQSLQLEISKLASKCDSLQKEVDEVKQGSHSEKLEFENLRKKLELEHQHDTERVKTEMNYKLKDIQENYQELENILKQTRQQLANLEKENQNLNSLVENQQGDAKNVVAQMQQQTHEYKSQILKLESEISELRRVIRTSSESEKSKQDHLNKISTENQHLHHQIESLKSDNDEIRKMSSLERKKFDETLRQLERENKILLEEKERAQMQIEKIASDLNMKMQQSAQGSEKLRAMEENQKKQQAQLNEERKIREAVQKELENMRREHEQLRAANEKRVADLEQLVGSLKHQKEQDKIAHEQELMKLKQNVPVSSPIVSNPSGASEEYEMKIKHLSDLVSNSSKIIATLNGRTSTLDKAMEVLKKQFTYTMTQRMTALTEASRKLSELQAKVNQSGTSYERQQKVFRLNLIQQGKIVRETISEYIDVISSLSPLSALVGDLVDYTKQSLGDMDQIMTQCEVMCREELDNVDIIGGDSVKSPNDKRTVVLNGFSVDDRIVFFRSQRNQELWEAFNVGMPNYFLSPEAVSTLKQKMGQHYAQTHVTIGVAVEIEKCNCPENNLNPLKLSGPYSIVTAVLE